jgi:hypothetical protein
VAGFHSKRSPSTAERWIGCPGSVALCEQAPPSVATEFAAEGTVFHRIVAMALRFGIEPDTHYGKIMRADGHEIEIGDEMVDYAFEAVDLARNIGRYELDIETRVSLDKWCETESGTLDVGHAGDEEITILDFKFGAGVAVSPVRNPQIMSYGLGYWNDIARFKTKANRFRFIIHQPRNPAGGGEWDCSLDTLLRFGKDLSKAHRRTFEKDAPLIPGEAQCKFCPAKTICPAYDKYMLETMSLKFEDLDAGKEPPPLKHSLTPARKTYLIQHRGLIIQWLKDIYENTLDDALKGRKISDLKAVYGRHPPSKWKDQDEAESWLVDRLGGKAYSRKVLSPTQAKKQLTLDDLESVKDLIDYGEPKPMLVDIDDKRPAITPAKDRFDDLSTER